MRKWSILPNLLYNIISTKKNSELTVFERLYIVNSLNIDTNQILMAELYDRCGCYDKSTEFYLINDKTRKLGDINWILGNFDVAYKYYSKEIYNKIENHNQNKNKDWDRIIKLAFYKEDWGSIINSFIEAPFQNSPFNGHTITSRSSGNVSEPSLLYLKILSIAQIKSGMSLPKKLKTKIEHNFNIKNEEWEKLLSSASAINENSINILKRKCLPHLSYGSVIAKPNTFENALTQGNTLRSQFILEFFTQADNLLLKAKTEVDDFLKTGEQKYLDNFLDIILEPKIISIAETFLVNIITESKFNSRYFSNEYLLRLFDSHDLIKKKHHGQLLDIKLKLNIPLSGEDILNGILINIFKAVTIDNINQFEKKIIDYNKLTSCYDWAEIKLQEWISNEGKDKIKKLIEIWRNEPINETNKLSEFYLAINRGYGDFFSFHYQWKQISKEAFEYLEIKWKDEIENSIWISETNLYTLIKQTFNSFEIIRHAQPIWLTPQHLDIYIPELSLAIEYMGKQHYEPIDFFGGVKSFNENIKRDNLKANICNKIGINLFYVKYDENIKQSVNKIKLKIKELCPEKDI